MRGNTTATTKSPRGGAQRQRSSLPSSLKGRPFGHIPESSILTSRLGGPGLCPAWGARTGESRQRLLRGREASGSSRGGWMGGWGGGRGDGDGRVSVSGSKLWTEPWCRLTLCGVSPTVHPQGRAPGERGVHGCLQLVVRGPFRDVPSEAWDRSLGHPSFHSLRAMINPMESFLHQSSPPPSPILRIQQRHAGCHARSNHQHDMHDLDVLSPTGQDMRWEHSMAGA
jgi:hypothetical protein